MSKDNPEAFETFEFDLPPIRGFPELRWAGKRPFKSTQYFPAQKKESYGDPTDGWWNRIYWGDNLQVMSHLLREFRGKVDLIYIDPPFDSKADYRKAISLRGKLHAGTMSSFEEKQYKDIWANDEYLQFLYERLSILRELLSDEGSIFLHCDYHKVHHIRSIMDEIFGPDKFVNEIIWQKCNTKNFTSNSISNIHDTILMFCKTQGYFFKEIFTELSEEYIEKSYKYKDENGDAYRLLPLTAPGERNGETGRPWKGMPPAPGMHWRFSHATLDQLDALGHIEISSGNIAEYRKYLSTSEGVRIGTIWLDSKQLPGTEKQNYPTQKPEKILERVIELGSKPGGIILDAFMGSGTAQAVAMRTGRKFLGADINLGAVETTVKRLNDVRSKLANKQSELLFDSGAETVSKLYTGFEVYNVNNYDLFRNPVEAKELIREAMELQPLPPSSAFDGQREGYLVKIMPVNRIATRQDLNEVINGLDFKAFERREAEAPNKPVERIHLVCMGHEPDLGPALQKEAKPFDIEVMVTDLIRDKAHLHFKKSSDARLAIENGELVIKGFYPMNLLQKLSLESDAVDDWRQLVESVKVDFHYDGAVLTPAIVDAPGKDELVASRYPIPADSGTIRVKITDLLSESWEGDIENG